MERLDEHDMTKRMLNIIRESQTKKLITESDDRNDTISPQTNDPIYIDQLNKLQSIVSPRVKINTFKIYPTDGNVVIDGVFLQKEDENSGIKFRLSLSKGEIETSINNIELNDSVNKILSKLTGYYDVWANDWALKMADDFKPKNQG